MEERVKERTKELTRVNKDLDNFVYTASHDLKAPINNIEGLVKVLQDMLHEHGTPPDVEPIIQMMNRSVGRFKNILSDLTEVAKVQYTAAEEDKITFGELLEEVKLNIQDMIG